MQGLSYDQMNHHENLNDWVTNYTAEAAKIKLKVPPGKVPKKTRPLIIATIYIDNEHTMLIDVRSIELAEKMIKFINKYIPKTVTEITHAAIYNQLITGTGNNPKSVMDVDYDDIFNQRKALLRYSLVPLIFRGALSVHVMLSA